MLVADHADDPAEVVVGVETDRGLLVGALVAAGYEVFAVNPLAASRYRDRHATSRAKSDRGDAKMLADLVRTDRHNHRGVAADSDLLKAVKVLARSHQNLIWTRQRQVNQLRCTLREFYPAALAAFDDLTHPDTLAVLAAAPTPERGRRLSTAKIRSAGLLLTLPGLGHILGARVLAEFGDAPDRYADAKAAATTPAPPPSPAHPAPAKSSSPASHATNACSAPATNGRSAR